MRNMKELTRHLYKARSDSCASCTVSDLYVSRGPKFFRRRRVDDVVRLKVRKVVEAGDTPKEGPGGMAGFKGSEIHGSWEGRLQLQKKIGGERESQHFGLRRRGGRGKKK